MEFYPPQASTSTSRSIYEHDYPIALARRNHIAASLGAPGFTIEAARQYPLSASGMQHDLAAHSQILYASQPASQYSQPLRYSTTTAPAMPSSTGLQRRNYPFIAPTSFSPYHPNEVKHRKRTTRPQQKLLEHTFRNETDKPDAALRNSLAAKLGMTSRNVQVWFQNRRAKEKKLKAAANASDEKDKQELEADEADEIEAVETSAPTDEVASSTSAVAPSSAASTFEPITVPTVPAIGASIASRPIAPAPIVTSAAQTAIANFGQAAYGSMVQAEGFVHRGSVPVVRASPPIELQHSRSASSPTFSAPSANVPHPLTVQEVPKMLYNYSNYPAQQSASTYVFPRAYQAPLSGPLPDAAYSFGNPQQQSGSDNEHEEEHISLPTNTRFGSIASVSGSESASLSGYSFFTNSDSTSSEGIYHVEDESSTEQAHSATSDSTQTVIALPITESVPLTAVSSGYSYTPPYSVASYSSACSPPSAGIATSHSGASPHHVGLAADISFGDALFVPATLQNYDEPKQEETVYQYNTVYGAENTLLQGLVGNYATQFADNGMSQNVSTQYAQPMDSQYAYGSDFVAPYFGAQYGAYQQ